MKDKVIIYVLVGVMVFSAVSVGLVFLTSDDGANNQDQTAQNEPAESSDQQLCQAPAAPSAEVASQVGSPAGEWPISVDPAEELQVIDLREGSGQAAEIGDCLSVHYRLSLADGTPVEGNDTFAAGGGPISFELSEGSLISGWVTGLPGLQEGGVRRLILPPSLGYGETERPGIPANSTLVFDVELVKVEF